MHGLVLANMLDNLALHQPNIVYHDFPALEKFVAAVIKEIAS